MPMSIIGMTERQMRLLFRGKTVVHEIIVLVGYAGSDDAVGCVPRESSRCMVSLRIPTYDPSRRSTSSLGVVFTWFLESSASYSS